MIQEFLDIVGICPGHLSHEQLRLILDDPLLLTEVVCLADQLQAKQISSMEFNLRISMLLVTHQAELRALSSGSSKVTKW